MKKTVLLIAGILFSMMSMAQTKSEVLEVVNRANDYFMEKWSDPTAPTCFKVIRPSNLWTRSVYYEGLLALYEQDPQQRFLDYTDKWANFHKWAPYKGNIKTFDADYQCCAQIYCTRYFMEGGEEKYKTMQQNFDIQIASGNNRRWTWIDAIQMAMPGFAMMSKITGDSKYIDYAMRSYTWSRDTCGGKLFNTEEGLWWRDANFVAPYKESDGQNCYWSRGNGWVYAALVRAMDAMLVAKSADAPAYMEPLGETKWRNIGVDDHFKDYRKDFLSMTKALVKCQRADKFWKVSLHDGNNYGGVELSGTALFIYGMAWGVRHGYLPKAKYAPIVYGTWDAMVKTCLHDDGFLGYVQGTGKQPSDSQPVTYDKQPDFDDYGLGCFLLCGTEVVRLIRQGK